MWSVMIPTYNCAKYLPETLNSVLAQDPGSAQMQIEVVDDGSMDCPRAVVEKLGRGRIKFHGHERNVGHVRNFEECLKRARGRLVHLLHGDDYVRGGFYAKMEVAFSSDPQIGAAFCRQIIMDADGHWQSISNLEQPTNGLYENALARLATEQRVLTPAVVVKREVYEQLGGFDERLLCAEDWEMWVRIAAHYSIWYEPEPLAVYRMHDYSNTGRHVRTGEDLVFTGRAIDLFRSHLPEQYAASWTRQARETYAKSGLWTAYTLLKGKDRQGANKVAREAFRLSQSPATFMHALRLVLKAVTS
jgi:glycosyltransferase involved in cell wall biosynthesis